MDSTDFVPGENQKAVLAAFEDAHYDISVAEACRKAGVDRTTFYTWFNRPGFADWWLAQANAHFGRMLPKVYADLARMSGGGEGSHGAAKILLDRFDKGFLPARRKEVEHRGMGIEDLSHDAIERIAAMVAIPDPRQAGDASNGA